MLTQAPWALFQSLGLIGIFPDFCFYYCTGSVVQTPSNQLAMPILNHFQLVSSRNLGIISEKPTVSSWLR